MFCQKLHFFNWNINIFAMMHLHGVARASFRPRTPPCEVRRGYVFRTIAFFNWKRNDFWSSSNAAWLASRAGCDPPRSPPCGVQRGFVFKIIAFSIENAVILNWWPDRTDVKSKNLSNNLAFSIENTMILHINGDRAPSPLRAREALTGQNCKYFIIFTYSLEKT